MPLRTEASHTAGPVAHHVATLIALSGSSASASSSKESNERTGARRSNQSGGPARRVHSSASWPRSIRRLRCSKMSRWPPPTPVSQVT